MSGSWPMVLVDLVVVVGLVSLAKALSDGAAHPLDRWILFVGLAFLFVLVGVAVPLRALLLRQQHGMLRATQQARVKAATDPLTGLLNRRSLDEVVRRLVHEEVPFSVSMCDLDHFKQLNDTHGHGTGDRALRLFADTLRSVVRNGDFVARLGGEEFVVVLPDAPQHIGVEVLERARLQLVIALDRHALPPFTFSAGVADTSEASEWSQLMHLADQRLLAAKRDGRDRMLAAAPSTGSPAATA